MTIFIADLFTHQPPAITVSILLYFCHRDCTLTWACCSAIIF